MNTRPAETGTAGTWQEPPLVRRGLPLEPLTPGWLRSEMMLDLFGVTTDPRDVHHVLVDDHADSPHLATASARHEAAPR